MRHHRGPIDTLLINIDSDRGPDDIVQEPGHAAQRQDGPRRWARGRATADPAAFPGGSPELGLRAEERRIGRVAPSSPNDYTVQTGPDPTPSSALKRACWNLQGSIADGGSISSLDALTFGVGPNLPTAPSDDLLFLHPFIDDRPGHADCVGVGLVADSGCHLDHHAEEVVAVVDGFARSAPM